MASYQVFFHRQRTGESIDSFAPQPMARDRILALAPEILKENGDYLGLVGVDDSVFQFMYLARDRGDQRPIRMDLSNIAQRGSCARHISGKDLRDLLQRLPDELTANVVPGLELEACGDR